MGKAKQEMNKNNSFKYFAFISYSSKDTTWGKKLQKKLEHYRMPATLCHKRGWKRNPMDPVFFAPTDIQPGELTEEIQERLKASQHLIVICSPNSAQSEWVGKEIAFFHNLGRPKNIHFFIVKGTPHGDSKETQCFNPIIKELGLPEILGANIHEKVYRWPWLNKERAYVQLISKLLGVEFDAIWQRHKRLMIRKTILWTIGVIAVIAAMFGIGKANQNFDTEIHLNEASFHNTNLPHLKDAVVTLYLDNETKTDTIRSLDTCVVFRNIPHRYLNKEVKFSVSCSTMGTAISGHPFIDTTMDFILTPCVTMGIRRNEHYYGDVSVLLYNRATETFLSDVIVNIAGIEATSDSNGRVSVCVPLEQQQERYTITCPLPLENDIITMPCGASDVVEVR